MVPHSGRSDIAEPTEAAVRGLQHAGIEVQMLTADAGRFVDLGVTPVAPDCAADGCELALVFGGDGTILRTAYLARGRNVPLLGVNFGHMGFLAESDPEDLPSVVAAIVDRRYLVEERLALDIELTDPQGEVTAGWAFNEVSIEKGSRERMIELIVAIDEQPLSAWAADGLICATPTGSTAYAWSAGGPVVWPNVEAIIVVPISAHALFSKPLVVGPESEIVIEVAPRGAGGVVWCDGGRMVDAPAGSTIAIRRSDVPVSLARLHAAPFTGRLVAKFDLPVSGWRGRQISREV